MSRYFFTFAGLSLGICLSQSACVFESSSDEGKPQASDCSPTGALSGHEGIGIRGGKIVASGSDAEAEYHTVGKLIGKLGTSGSLCTGNLIAPNFILTADHCVHENDVALTEFTFQQNEGYAKAIASQVFRYDGPSPFRDVALVMLDGFFDETLAYPRLMKRALPTEYTGNALQMVGFGGYTNQLSLSTYRIGEKRRGDATFAGYENVSADFLGGEVDFLTAAPGPENGEVICQGDSGSSLLYTKGPFNMVVGVTSIGEFDTTQFMNPNNGTQAEKCHYGTKGYFVPSFRVYDWINSTIKAQEPNYRNLDTDILITGIIDSVSTGKGGEKTILLSEIETHDAPKNVRTNEFLLTDKTTLLGGLFVGRKVLIQGNTSEENDLPTATLIASKDAERIAKGIGISGVITGSPITAEVFGRTETYITLENLRISEKDYDKLPVNDQSLELILCTKGCSVNVDIAVDKLSNGDELSVSGDYILGKGFYARSIIDAMIEHTNAECRVN